jgi:hypothetical protein
VARLFFASLVTFGLLIGMLAGVLLAGMVALGEVNLTVAIVLTVIINLVIWLISPWLSDLTLRWFNKLEFLDDATVKARYPGVHALIHQVADEYRFSAPKIGFISDRNPTAFTYGLLRSNARIVVTQGIFEFLNEEEQRAVVAHELGHIVNRDFILMIMVVPILPPEDQPDGAVADIGRLSDRYIHANIRPFVEGRKIDLLPPGFDDQGAVFNEEVFLGLSPRDVHELEIVLEQRVVRVAIGRRGTRGQHQKRGRNRAKQYTTASSHRLPPSHAAG